MIRRNKARLAARTVAMSHEQLIAKGRAFGFPAVCCNWPLETLIRKIKEKENASR